MTDTIVRNSELSLFRKCRQAWAWAYIDGYRSTRRKPALEFGDLIHQTFELYYPPGRKRGGDILELWEHVWAENDVEDFPVLKVKDDEPVMASELGPAMLTGYILKYGQDSNFEIIAPEMDFQVDVVRADGKVMGIFVGTMDAVIRDRKTKKIGLFEHKTGASLENFGAPLIMDEQAGTYWTFGPVWLKHVGVLAEGEDLDFILYNRLRKAMPDHRPTNEAGEALNQNGTVSKRQPTPMYKREYTFRGTGDRASLQQRVIDQMREISLVKRGKLPIYKNPGDACNFCEFREMCEVHEVQSDWEAVADATMTRWDPYEAHRGNTGASDA